MEARANFGDGLMFYSKVVNLIICRCFQIDETWVQQWTEANEAVRSKMKRLLVISLLSVFALARAEVIPVDLKEDCKIDSTPTMTMYWAGQQARAVLVLIPGGDGNIGIKPEMVDLKNPFYKALKRLSDPALTSGTTDVVIFDSPYPLSPNQPYPSARGTSDHIKRMESVLAFYRKKTHLPVWVMGHSNGGISLMELIRYLQKTNQTKLIDGMVVSSARNESSFSAPLNFPILFIDHKNNGCTKGTQTVYRTYESVKKITSSPVGQVLITSGESQSADPCRSGFHMYFKAEEELSKALDDFIGKNTH